MKLPKGHAAKAFELHGTVFSTISGEQLVGVCPFCQKASKFYCNKSNLMWDCKSCGKNGNLYGFLKYVVQRNVKQFRQSARNRLAEDRQLPPEAFDGWDIGYDGRRYTIPVYNLAGSLVDVRHYIIGRRGVRSTNGCRTNLLGLQKLARAHPNTPVYLCEGEWDAITLRYMFQRTDRRGLITGLPGASIFRDEWMEPLQNRDVYLCYDHDKPGAEGELRASRRLRTVARSIQYLRFDSERPIGFDTRDWFIEWLGSGKPRRGTRLYCDLFTPEPRLHDEDLPDEDQERDSNSKYPQPATLEQVEEVFNKWLYLKNTDGIKVALATVVSNQIDGDPIWMFLVAPPGGSKTVTVQAFDKNPECHITSSLTAHSLISGMNFKNGTDPSLIPKLDRKVLCIKDFTSILTLRDNEKDEIFGILRDAYDGKCGKEFGNGVSRSYTSRFSILAAVTPSIYSEGAKHTSLGERFLKFALQDNLKHLSEEDIIAKAISNVNSERAMKEELIDVVTSFCRRRVETTPTIPEPILKKIIALAKYGARIRATVQRDRFRPDIVEGRPSAEVGSRLGKQLAKMGISLAAIEGKSEVDKRDLQLLKKIVIDTVPQRVEDIVRFLWKECTDTDDTRSTADIAAGTRYPMATVSRLMQNFLLLGVVNRVGSKTKFRWKLSSYIEKCIQTSQIYAHKDTATRDRIRYMRKRRSSKRKTRKTST